MTAGLGGCPGSSWKLMPGCRAMSMYCFTTYGKEKFHIGVDRIRTWR